MDSSRWQILLVGSFAAFVAVRAIAGLGVSSAGPVPPLLLALYGVQLVAALAAAEGTW